MRKILNYFTGVIITFLFLIFNDLDEKQIRKSITSREYLYDQYIYDCVDFENKSSFSRM